MRCPEKAVKPPVISTYFLLRTSWK